jgi:hypothetical protein
LVAPGPPLGGVLFTRPPPESFLKFNLALNPDTRSPPPQTGAAGTTSGGGRKPQPASGCTCGLPPHPPPFIHMWRLCQHSLRIETWWVAGRAPQVGHRFAALRPRSRLAGRAGWASILDAAVAVSCVQVRCGQVSHPSTRVWWTPSPRGDCPRRGCPARPSRDGRRPPPMTGRHLNARRFAGGV